MTDWIAAMPAGAEAVGVEAGLATAPDSRPALRVALVPALRAGQLGRDFGDKPTFLLLPGTLTDAGISVDLCARLLPDAPEYARGFIGLAYRVAGQGDRFEAVYLRPTNGLTLAPPPPRDRRAVQYFAFPDWPYDRLRAEEPEGRHEAPADIAPGRWARLRLRVAGSAVTAWVDGAQVLHLDAAKAVPAPGRIGLWVDIGTEGFFRNLRVVPA